MKKLFFVLIFPLMITACDFENRWKEPGVVRNDTVYDMQYVVNEHRRDEGFEEIAKNADYKFCVDSAKIDPKAICVEVYDPVCGCDKITYANSCKAENAGVLRYTKGECKEDVIK